MQSQPIVAIIVLFLVIASLSAAGCTVQTTPSTPSSTQSTVDEATKITNDYKAQNMTIITPFTQSTNQYGNTVYTGTIQDGGNAPYTHKITIEQTNNRTTNLARFSAYVAQAQEQQGYNPGTLQTSDYFAASNGLAQAVRVQAANPYSSVGMATGLSRFDTGTNYYVIVDYATKT